MSTYQITKKLIVVGDRDIGKTSLLKVECSGEFPTYVPTVFENYLDIIQLDSQNIGLQLVETTGYEEYDRLRPLSYPGTDIVLICFSYDIPDSLENVKERWLPEIDHHCENSIKILVGLKKDLQNNPEVIRELKQTLQSPVTDREAQEVADSIGAAEFYSCSAYLNEGVREVFEGSVRLALAKANGYKWNEPNTRKCIPCREVFSNKKCKL